MAGDEQTRQSDYIMPPINGGITCLAASTAAVTVDLTTMSGSPGNQVNGADVSIYGGKNVNPLGHYITLQADGGDVYIAFGDTVGHLSSIANVTQVSTVTNNALVTSSTANAVVKIPIGTQQNFKLPVGSSPAQGVWGNSSPSRFLCFLTATGTATLRMWQSSP